MNRYLYMDRYNTGCPLIIVADNKALAREFARREYGYGQLPAGFALVAIA